MSGEYNRMSKSKFKFFIVYLIVIILTVTSNAQVDTTSTDLPFQVFAYSAPKGIMLVIVGDWIIPTKGDNLSGYNIYRKENEKDTFKKITPFPLKASSTYSDMVDKIGQSLDGMFPIVGVEDSAQFWQLLVSQDESIAVWGTMFKKFREAMGQLLYDYEIESGKTYTYVCTKTDASGVESAFSLEISATSGTPLFELLGPVDVTAEAKDNQAVITWHVNEFDSAAFSYNIYRAYDSLGRYTRLNSEMIVPMFNDGNESATEMSFVDTLMKNGRKYYYAVVSVDYADNESSRNNILSVFAQDTKAPAVPKNIKSESGKLGISILWDLSPEDDIAGYALYRSVDVDSVFEKVHTDLLPLNVNRYEDVTAQSGDEYFYRLTAVDQAGNESEQSANVYGFYIDPSRPLPPMNLKAEADSSQITLSWSKIENNEILGYYVFRTSSYKGEFSQVSDLIPREDTLWTDTSSLSSLSTYYYAMKSSTLNGNFSYYNEAVAVKPLPTERALPTPPSDFYGYADYTGVRLHWKMPLDKSVYGYNIYRITTSESSLVKLNDSLLIFSTTSFLDKTAKKNQTYSYYIKSVHFEGIEGNASHEVEITPLAASPEPPDNFRAFVQNGIITLKWSKILLDDMKGYNIYKHTGDGLLKRVNKEIIALNNTEFKDGDISSQQRYYYSISTVSIDNRESFQSTAIDIMSK